MTKTGKIGIIIGVLSFIAVIVVCASTVFTVKRVQLVWYTTNSTAMSKVTGEQILLSSGVKNSSVFNLDRQLAISNLEREYVSMRIIDVEVIYPNVLKIHALERQKVFAIPTTYGDYMLTDEYLRVLDVVQSFSSNNINPILLNMGEVEHYKVGEDIDFARTQTFVDVYNAFFSLKQDLGHMRAMIKSMDYTNSKLTFHTYFDVDIILDNPTQNTQVKMRTALRTFDLLGSEEYGKVDIVVYLNDEGKINSDITKKVNN